MPWDPRLSIIPSIDEEHKKLIGLIDQLHAAMKAGKGKTEAPAIINQLVEYTQTHFEGEIRLLRRYGYPGVTGHEQEHQKLLKEVQDRLAKAQENSVNTLDLMNFLESWVTNHIFKHDMAYKDHLVAKGVK